MTSRPYLTRVLVGAVASVGSNIWTTVLGVATLPILLKGLGVELFGLWALLQILNGSTGWLSVVSIGNTVAGAQLVAEKLSVNDRVGAANAFASVVVAGCTFGVIAGTAIALCGSTLLEALLRTEPEHLFQISLWFGLYLFAEQLTLSLHAGLEGMQRVDLGRLSESVRRTATLGCAAGAALATESLVATVAAFAIAATGYGLVLLLAVTRYVVNSGLRPDNLHLRELFQRGRGVAAVTALGVAQRSMDRLLAALFFGPIAVGLVEIATQVRNVASSILSAITYVAISVAPWLKSRNADEESRRLFLLGTKLSLLVTLPVAVFLALMAGPLIEVWIGEDGARAVDLIPVAVLYVAVAAPMQLGSNMLLGLARTGANFQAAAVGVAADLIASLVLVDRFGLVGLFWGAVIGVAFSTPVTFHYASRVTGVNATTFVRSAVLPVMLPLAIFASLVGIIESSSLDTAVAIGLSSIAGALVYVASTRLALSREELKDLSSVLTHRH